MRQARESSRKTTVLVVDDDSDICVALEMLLAYEGLEVWTAPNGRQALQRLDKEESQGRSAQLVLTDVKMPELDGLALLEAIKTRPRPIPVIVISGHADLPTAVDAIKKGAADFLEKPLDQSRVLVSVRNALRSSDLARENVALKAKLSARFELVGTSEPMKKLAREIERAAAVDAAILITGENGTGKEIVARNLHLLGPRGGGPFVAMNCAAIPAELVESELFGHEKGSFTGAVDKRIGHFEAADGGTLFLDEVGDMPLAAQAKVLRALETREITRVGGHRPLQVDIRVVAATNADLAAAVEEKNFRMDLFYRLNVVPLRVPALRERLDDVALLAERFLGDIGERTGRRPRAMARDALALLQSLPFPGNVRQLKNLLEAACVFSEDTISREVLEEVLGNGTGVSAPVVERSVATADDPFEAPTFEEFKDKSEALFFRRKLAANDGNVKRTAERLGMQRSHMYKKLERYGLKGYAPP